MTEKDLAKKIVKYLKEKDWEVFQEVQFPASWSVSDIYAIKDQKVWIIEVKTSFSDKVVDQALNWIGNCHFVSVAVPVATKVSKPRMTKRNHCREKGIGVLEVWGKEIFESVQPKRFSKPRLLGNPVGEQKFYAEAGNAEGRRWSPFQQTKKKLITHVAENPGIPLDIAVEDIDHHYPLDTVAFNALKKWITIGRIKELRYEETARETLLYLRRNSKGVSQ